MRLTEYLEKTAKKYPEKQAFTDLTESVTYDGLLNMAKSGGTFISENGNFNSPVAVFMKRSAYEICAFFAVLYSGNHYVPIDAEMPAARIKLIFENIKTKLIICDETTEKIARRICDETNSGCGVNEYGKANFYGDADEYGKINADNEWKIPAEKCKCVLFSDMVNTKTDEGVLSDVSDRASDSDPAYVLFTSGSTGVPKGVCSTHKNVEHYINEFVRVIGINRDTRFGEQAPLYFDASLKEIYSCVFTGAEAVIIPKEYFMSPVRLIEFLNEQKINTICWVVSALTIVSGLKTFDVVIPEFIHTITAVGEVFPVKSYVSWRHACEKANIFNLYGPTECTGVSTYYKIPEDFGKSDKDTIIPIGKPFPGVKVFLINENKSVNREILAEDTKIYGEICIAGAGVSMGYYNDPVRTRENFVKIPAISCTSETIYKTDGMRETHDAPDGASETSFIPDGAPETFYKTGDIGYFDKDGNLVFVSRRDFQIKHMGHRVELGEIERNVMDIAGVCECACTHNAQNDKICLFYTGGIEKDALMRSLRNSLQKYMLPNKIVKLDKMPYTKTGKVDRKNLNEEEC